MWSERWRWGVVLIVAGAASPASAQTEAETAAFLDALRTTAERFDSHNDAVAEGYRRLGPDFPGMGEHWIKPGLVIRGELDPAAPPVIAYTTVDGERRLVGFAYTRVLAPDEVPPEEGPFPESSWHDHTGEVDEETLLLNGPESTHSAGSGFRLAMVHVWMPHPNPNGTFSQNNWALPFLRAGLTVHGRPSRDAARALSLARGGHDFYHELLRVGLELRDEELRAASAVFEDAGTSVTDWLDGRDSSTPATAVELERLEDRWAGVFVKLEQTLSATTYERVSMLR